MHSASLFSASLSFWTLIAFCEWSHAEKIKIVRDPWGVPHIFADTDAGAFWGLGYATAEDRGFQMTYLLRTVQGRLAEVTGRIPHLLRDDTSIENDRKMRTFGFYREAQRLADRLDSESQHLLQSYCEGVNRYFSENEKDLHPLFNSLPLEHEPWTPADCLASWWHLGQFFGTDGTRDLIARRNHQPSATPFQSSPRLEVRKAGPLQSTTNDAIDDPEKLFPDESASVVQMSDLSEEWVDRVIAFASERGMLDADSERALGDEGPKFSHAWVVGGKRSTTGSATLVSDPQTPVRNPSFLYQFHICGETINARGAGVAGSPILLIGFNNFVVWGATAFGADQADLFQLDTHPDFPDQYRFDGQWRPMTVVSEEIKVKNGQSIFMKVRQTHLGPVVTEFCFAQPGEPEVALKRIPLCETERETIQGALAMMRANNVQEFDAALAGWRFPSANMVFGDRLGNIGYRVVGAIPVRSRLDPSFGRWAQPGHRSDQDWQEIIPYDLLPGVINPKSGHLFSANHRSIESWYPLPLGIMTGSGGDSLRSYRLREQLENKEIFTPRDVLDIHFDSVNPARRDIVRLGLHHHSQEKDPLSGDAIKALAHLEQWYHEGARMTLDQDGAELALEFDILFRPGRTKLSQIYGGGESGLTLFLKTVTERLDKNPTMDLRPVEREFIDRLLSDAWRSASAKYGPKPDSWNQLARDAVSNQRLAYYESLDGFPGLDSSLDIPVPPLTRTDPGTIGFQIGQSYTQWVPLHDPDQAMAILPIGQSEAPESPWRTSSLELWRDGTLHPAPLSKEKVGELRVVTKVIEIE